ncbi:Actin cytoskeleton-regulatory complex protein PAN1-like protein 1 [Zalerion maritima]|uniref:Actin cytoskeleton-regulatory complex protein PAN1-like protein 1 n=1 Tax=Zalerion maritima TaxID=339359 RepID=A0AAD5RSB6_9PEZI|nr:Actin cytoskeleton-regulatory complex protein PAN1-like protein 1 [Zalerion maritima]
MPAINKNWNDRADKDLFFTILSVKNIGIISGGEWTIIGNHMRSLGYGFTNEGCRQHFQGLRRAQNKADTNGASKTTATTATTTTTTTTDDPNPRNIDPNVNPITRRPGPGRGRPRKQLPVPIAGLNPNQPGQPQQLSPQQPPLEFHQPDGVQQTPPPPQLQAHVPPAQQTPVPVPVIPASAPPSAPVPAQEELKFEATHDQEGGDAGDAGDAGGIDDMGNDADMRDASVAGDRSGAAGSGEANEELDIEDEEGDQEEQQVAKRPRLESQTELEESNDQQMDDVVLALTGHNSTEVGNYGGADFGYGEA